MEHLMVQTKKDLDRKDKSQKPSLDDLTLSDLNVLFSRQAKLLSNPLIVKNLPDGGEKLRLHLSKIEATMKLKEKYDDAVLALGGLKIEEHQSPVSSSTAKSPVSSSTAKSPVSSSTAMSPISSSTTKSRVSTSEIMDSDKLERVRTRIRSRSPSTTKLLTGEEVQEIACRPKPKEERARESEARLGDFLGMFKIGNVQAEIREESTYRNKMDGEDSDSCSEVSDHSKSSGGEQYELPDEFGLLEDCL